MNIKAFIYQERFPSRKFKAFDAFKQQNFKADSNGNPKSL